MPKNDPEGYLPTAKKARKKKGKKEEKPLSTEVKTKKEK
jgi:hypothetical protein